MGKKQTPHQTPSVFKGKAEKRTSVERRGRKLRRHMREHRAESRGSLDSSSSAKHLPAQGSSRDGAGGQGTPQPGTGPAWCLWRGQPARRAGEGDTGGVTRAGQQDTQPGRHEAPRGKRPSPKPVRGARATRRPSRRRGLSSLKPPRRGTGARQQTEGSTWCEDGQHKQEVLQQPSGRVHAEPFAEAETRPVPLVLWSQG